MKILFLCDSYSDKLREKFASCSKVGLNNALNTFQTAFISGLMDNDADFEVQCFPSLGTYPLRFTRLFVPGGDYVYNGTIIGKSLSYCALPLLKEASICCRAKDSIRKILDGSNGELIVITYNLSSSVIKPLTELKKEFKGLIICPIVTDLIDEFFNPIYKRSFFKTIQGKREIRIIHSCYKYIDKFILLTKSMEEKIPESIGRNIVVEGIYSGEYQQPKSNSVEQKTLLYTGALAAHAGIKDLIDAFMMIPDSDFRLVICGNGELATYVKEKAIIDSRIKYMGLIPRNEVIKLQQEATAVINPRKPSISLTKYSFPSKTMEYLASGTPMIGYKLAGIPEEYYDYFYTVNGLTNQDLAKTITEVLDKPADELNAKAKTAQIFIANNKTSKIQVKKILDFLSE